MANIMIGTKVGIKQIAQIAAVSAGTIACVALLAFFGNIIMRGLIVPAPINQPNPPITLNYPVYLFTPNYNTPFVLLNNGGTYTLTQSQLKQPFALTVVPTLTIPNSNVTIIIDSYKWTLYKTTSNENDITWGDGTPNDLYKTFIPYGYNSSNIAFTFPGKIIPGTKRVNLTLKYHLSGGLADALTASMTFTIAIPCSVNCKVGDVNCDNAKNAIDSSIAGNLSLASSGLYACTDVNNNGVYWDAQDIQATINAQNSDQGYWPYTGAFVNTADGAFKYFPQIIDPNSKTSIQASNLLTPTLIGFWMIGKVDYKNYAITNSDTNAQSLSLQLFLIKYQDNLQIQEDDQSYQNINKDSVNINDFFVYNQVSNPFSNNYNCIIYKNQPFIIETHTSTDRVIRNIYWLTVKQHNKPPTGVWAEADWLGQNTGYIPRWNYILLNNYINAYPNILTGNNNCTVVATGP